MKSFSQFLEESYLSEEIPAGMTRDQYNALPSASRRRLGGSNAAYGKKGQPLQGAASDPAIRSARKKVNPQGKTTKVKSPAAPTSSGSKPTWRPGGQNVNPTFKPQQGPKPAAPSSTPTGGSGGGPSGPSGPKPPVGKPPAPRGLKAPGVRSGGVLAGAIDTALEKSSGSGWARSLAKGTTTALGTVAGGAAGSFIAPGAGTFVGGTAGGMAASKAFDTVAGANAVGRKQIATANRQSQSGGALKGIGGKTTFDTKKGTMTTGSGSQQKTVKLGKTSVVTGPGGKQDVGYLAYKGGKAVYKRADTKNLAQTSSNPLERIGRSLFAGAYKKSDAAKAQQALTKARQSDVARNKALGVKALPGK